MRSIQNHRERAARKRDVSSSGPLPRPTRSLGFGLKAVQQMVVHFGGRNDDARTRLSDLSSDGWIKIDEPNLTPFHHFRELSASLANSGHTSASSPLCASCLAASAHPARTDFLGLRKTIASRSMVISTSFSVNPT
jgi:hypothetical protein